MKMRKLISAAANHTLPRPIATALWWLVASTFIFTPLVRLSPNPDAGMVLFKTVLIIAIIIAASPWLVTRSRVGRRAWAALWPFGLIVKEDAVRLARHRSITNWRIALRNAGLGANKALEPYAFRWAALILSVILVDELRPAPLILAGVMVDLVFLFAVISMAVAFIYILVAAVVVRNPP